MYTILLVITFWNGTEVMEAVTSTGSDLAQCQAVVSRMPVQEYGKFHAGRGGAKAYRLDCRK